jgi:uncharacterized coiled-coil DUF342 family protein
LREELEASKKVAENNASLRVEMDKQRAEIDQLRERVKGYEGKEDLIKNKLKSIVGRIDQLESEVEALEPVNN